MAIKIPRGSQPEVRLPTTNTLGVVANNPVSRSFNKLTSFLDVVATRKAENDKRIEAQRILNKNTTNKSLLEKSKNEFLQHIEDSQEVLTQENYNILLKDWEKKQENWIKQSYKDDDKALEMFLSDKIDVFNSTFVGLNEKRNQKVLAQGKIVFDTEIQNVNEKIDGLPVSAFVWDKFDIILKEEKNRWENGLVTGYTTSSWKEREKELTNLVMKRVVSANKLWTNPITNRVEPDYMAIYSELNEAKSSKSWYGKTFTLNQIDALKIYFKKQSDTQIQIMNDFADRAHKKSYKGFVDDLIEIKRGTENSADLAATFEERVQNAKYLNDETKLSLQKNLLTWQTTKGVKPWETPAGKNATTLAHIITYNGLVDTKQEFSFISELFAKELISDEDFRTLSGKVDDNIKIKNMKKTRMFKNALGMIATEIGKTDLMELFQSMDGTPPTDEILLALGSNLDQETYDALNYFMLVLGAGEKQGFSYESMLIKGVNKENYVLDNLLGYLKESTGVGGKLPDFLTEHPAVTGSIYDPTAPYTLAPSVWFAGKEPVGLQFEVPKRLEGENISNWINRTMETLKKNKEILPSTVTGFQFEQDADLNSIFIVPKVD
jgi:hypothetical protein